ncbi:MAG TPA: hypothetical protein VFW11_06530 [Cyclobacteriaceae bacterium]|nr:hypothetical protein [Cyclobacteriaceae bacterium]
MDSKRIEELLSKYWNCETSLEEEQSLREFFNGGTIPDQFREASLLFQYFQHQKKKSVGDLAFDENIPAEPKEDKGKIRKFNLVYNSLRIAAGIAVLMTAIWFVRSEIRQNTPQEMVDTYNDPQLAFEETKKALMMISKSFGTAEEQAKKINLFNEAQEQIEGKHEEEGKQ